MGSYWKEKEEYERRKRDDETNRALLGFILSVIGIILTFIFSNILAPLISKYPKASFVVILAVCIGCFFILLIKTLLENLKSKNLKISQVIFLKMRTIVNNI